MGRLLGIARAPTLRAALVELDEVQVGDAEGVRGDARGRKSGRQVTVLFREGWESACGELGVRLPWVARRANLFVEGVAPPREGGQLRIGDLVLEVTQETQPCHLMEAAQRGLKRALTPEWRGGVCCRVLKGGTIRVGDSVEAS
ncbi:MAG TPA: MOSC domain-containing protein [Micropepsaceae bacterium]|nr:MOSC domain-containing protein [Micropepsaceae bacterium]